MNTTDGVLGPNNLNYIHSSWKKKASNTLLLLTKTYGIFVVVHFCQKFEILLLVLVYFHYCQNFIVCRPFPVVVLSTVGYGSYRKKHQYKGRNKRKGG